MARTSPWSLTILTNNYAKGAGLRGEHGFAVHLRREGTDETGTTPRRVLFDTGQTGEVLAHNAAAVGIDLKEIDALVLSHGHYDHTGGLDAIIQARAGPNPLPVYAHPAAFDVKLRLQPRRRDIGSPFSRAHLERAGLALQLSEAPLHIAEDLWATGEVPRHHDVEKEAIAGFYTIAGSYTEHPEETAQGGGTAARARTDDEVPGGPDDGGRGRPAAGPIPDSIPDDQSLIVVSPRAGFYLICGCCHAGLLNTLDYAVQLLRNASGRSAEPKLRGIIGGLHTTGASAERLEHTIRGLRDYAPDWIAPIHCSGQREAAILHEALGERVRFPSVGDRFVLE
jgi:7,8-dihydropterin-6-yl-methyl-4-(beta-D-ribofuranosyl)aminobenzene 5'-phosphate synthase